MKEFYDFLGFMAFWSICTVASFTGYAIVQLAFGKALTMDGFIDFIGMLTWALMLNAIYEGFKRGR